MVGPFSGIVGVVTLFSGAGPFTKRLSSAPGRADSRILAGFKNTTYIIVPTYIGGGGWLPTKCERHATGGGGHNSRKVHILKGDLLPST
jgi:hypothetical protein